MERDKWFYICEKNSYRFYERVSNGLLKVPNLKIVRLTCQGVETDEEYIELCCIELKFLIPIFQQYIALRNIDQLDRIDRMRDFIKGRFNPNYLNVEQKKDSRHARQGVK